MHKGMVQRKRKTNKEYDFRTFLFVFNYIARSFTREYIIGKYLHNNRDNILYT